MEVNGLDYLESLRHIVNEISFGNDAGGGDDSASDNDDTGDQNFMDDGDEDTASDTTTDDSSGDDGDQNFMDDGDDSSEEGSDESSDDASGDDAGGNENFMDDDTGDEEGSDDTGDDTSSDGGDENFMDDGGDDSGDDEGSDDSSEEGSDDSSEEENSDEEGQENYDINKIEEELFSSLTPEQIAIKNHELKNQFIELYSIIGSTLVRINDISKTNENINVLKFITEKLLELREMIDFNITTAYQTRTYIENNIIYQQCIATLNAIGDIIDNIPKLNDVKVHDEEEIENQGEPVENDKESFDSLNVSDSSMSDYQEESTEYNNLF